MNMNQETPNQGRTMQSGTESVVDTAQETDTSATPAQDTPSPAPGTDSSTEAKAFQSPFDENGRAKFVVDGEEVERDWETIQREYQLAAASRKRFEQAADIKRKAETAYRQIYEAAQTDPIGLIRTFRPDWSPDQTPHGQAKPGAQNAQGQPVDANGDVIDSRLSAFEQRVQSELERRLAPVMEKFNAMSEAEERQAINKEYETISQKFPALKGKAEKNFLFNQYRATLEKGVDMSFEDVAFYVNKEIEEERQASRAPLQEKQQENKRKAPVSARPAASTGHKEFTSLEQVRALANGTLNGG